MNGLLDPPNAALDHEVVARRRATRRDAARRPARRAPARSTSTSTRSSTLFADRDGAGRRVGRTVGSDSARRERVARRSTRPLSRVAPGAGIGPVYPVDFDDTSDPPRYEVDERVAPRRRRTVGAPRTSTRSSNGRLSAKEARPSSTSSTASSRRSATSSSRSTGRPCASTANGDVRIDTVGCRSVRATTARCQPNQDVRFQQARPRRSSSRTRSARRGSRTSCSSPGFALIMLRVLHRGRRHRGVRRRGARSSAVLRLLAPAGAVRGRSHCLLIGLFGLAIDLQAGGLGAVDLHRQRRARRGFALAVRRFVARSIPRGGSSRSCAVERCSSCCPA